MRESERGFRNIFENVEVGFIEVQDDYRISYANPEARRYLCITGEPENVDIRSLFLKRSDREYINEVMARSFSKSEPAKCEIEYNDRWFSIAIAPICENVKNAEQILMVMMDVTNQRRIQQELIQSERIRVLGRMASGIAHDFNNILSVIMGRTELMLVNMDDKAELKSGLQTIQKAASDGAETVKRIQEFTRVARQQEFVELDPNEVVRETVSMTEPRWKDQVQRDGIKIDLSMQSDSQLTISGSAPDLKEALTNMIFNAVEAMPYGGALNIRTYDAYDKVCISISDTGTGIESDAINSIFEPFFTTKGVGHAGLGLSVAYGIINRHGGEINVESSGDSGTTFVVKLSARVEKAGADEASAESAEPGKANVLVIDDEQNIRELLANILSRSKHNVTAVSNGMCGIKTFEEGDFDIVFTDLGMPKMSGWQVADRIKAIDPNAMVVLVTGWGVELDSGELRDKNVDAVIAKPFQIKQITDAVSRALEMRGA